MVDKGDDRFEPDDIDPDAPASEEEVAASARLRDALDAAGRERDAAGSGAAGASPELELALALRAAWSPEALDDGESRAVLDATPSAEEQELAARLRDALAEAGEPRATDPAAVHLARALRAAFAPGELGEAEHRAILDEALAKMPVAARAHAAVGGAQVLAFRRRATVVRVAFGAVAGGLALAASIVFVVTSAPMHGTEAPLAQARTTQPLFSEPFKAGESSARIDRIASARASDFRSNRFAKWGVR